MSTAPQRYSADEYLAQERASERKNQYFDGEIFAMAGGSEAHNLISGNWIRELGNALKRRCRVYPSDMRVVCPTGLWTYPDVTVACDEPQFHDERRDSLLNPQAIVEVLSSSTAEFDRGRKFANYQTIESLREYVLVEQDRPQVEILSRKPDGKWETTTVTDLEASVELAGLGCVVSMPEIYLNVRLPS